MDRPGHDSTRTPVARSVVWLVAWSNQRPVGVFMLPKEFNRLPILFFHPQPTQFTFPPSPIGCSCKEFPALFTRRPVASSVHSVSVGEQPKRFFAFLSDSKLEKFELSGFFMASLGPGPAHSLRAIHQGALFVCSVRLAFAPWPAFWRFFFLGVCCSPSLGIEAFVSEKWVGGIFFPTHYVLLLRPFKVPVSSESTERFPGCRSDGDKMRESCKRTLCRNWQCESSFHNQTGRSFCVGPQAHFVSCRTLNKVYEAGQLEHNSLPHRQSPVFDTFLAANVGNKASALCVQVQTA